MSTAGLFILIGVGVGVAAFIVWPLVFGPTARADANPTQETGTDPAGPSRMALQHQHQAILADLRAVEFDYQTGKLLAEDYQKDRARLVALGAETLRQIDALSSTPNRTAQTAKTTTRPKRRSVRKS